MKKINIEMKKLSEDDQSKFLQAIGGRLPTNSIYGKNMRCSNALSDAKNMLIGAMNRYAEFENSDDARDIALDLKKIDSI